MISYLCVEQTSFQELYLLSITGKSLEMYLLKKVSKRYHLFFKRTLILELQRVMRKSQNAQPCFWPEGFNDVLMSSSNSFKYVISSLILTLEKLWGRDGVEMGHKVNVKMLTALHWAPWPESCIAYIHIHVPHVCICF